jgi:tryptophan-rich sensory protein
MQRNSVIILIWMLVAFAVGTIVISPVNGAALSFLTTFAVWGILELQDTYERGPE